MKIDADLRIAIRSAEKAQPSRDTWLERRNANKKAIAGFLKTHPRAAKDIKAADDMFKRAQALRDRAGEVYDRLGIRSCQSEFSNDEKFVKAGGKLPGPINGRWKADAVIAELMAAAPNQRAAILKKYNIRWE